VNGYRHWSSYLYTRRGGTGGKKRLLQRRWLGEAFQCPDIERGDFRHQHVRGQSMGMGQVNDQGDSVVDFQGSAMRVYGLMKRMPSGTRCEGFQSPDQHLS